MKKNLLALLCITIACINIKAQKTPFLQWQNTVGTSLQDSANSIQQTNDGGYIIAGETYGPRPGSHGYFDYWIVKLNAEGRLQWRKSYGGSAYDNARSIQQTKDGGYIVAGYSWSNDQDVTGNHGQDDYWIIKLDAKGALQWEKTYGGTGYDVANSIQQTTDGGYIVAGNSTSIDGDVTGNHGGEDYWIIKLDINGKLEWEKSFGGTKLDDANNIKQTTDGGYIVAGFSTSRDGDLTGHYGSYDYWIIKLSALGNLQWQKNLGGTAFDGAYSIQQTTDGGYIVAGYTWSNNGNVTGNHGSDDAWIVKLSASGNLQWQKTYGEDKWYSGEGAYSIQQTVDGGYIVAGYSWSFSAHGQDDYWIIKLNASGRKQWQKFLGGTSWDIPFSIQQTTDGGYIVAGNSASIDGDVTGNHGNYDYWIVKLSPENLGNNITLYPYKIVANCYPGNAVSCTMKNNTKAPIVKLYRYGVLYDSALNVTDHTGFTNLPWGNYYATATDENGNISCSKEVQIVPTPINTTTTNITSTTAQLNWTGFDCADEYLIQFHEQGDKTWVEKAPGDVNNFVLDKLIPSTTYVWRVASEKRVNGIKAIGRFSDSLTFTTLASITADNLKAININSVQLIVSPNPAKDFFIILFNSTKEHNVNAILYDVNGKTVWTSGSINANTLNGKQINTSQFAKGIFYLKLMNEQGELIGSTKIVIAK